MVEDLLLIVQTYVEIGPELSYLPLLPAFPKQSPPDFYFLWTGDAVSCEHQVLGRTGKVSEGLLAREQMPRI